MAGVPEWGDPGNDVTVNILYFYKEDIIMTYPVLDMEATGRRIKELRIQNNLSVEDVREYLGFECCQSIYKWQRGESLPLVDNLLILSRLFHTSMDDIIQVLFFLSPFEVSKAMLESYIFL
jgi:hypothetical protein